MPSTPMIACVLKSGGDYNRRYVDRLLTSLDRHISEPYSPICFSDMNRTNGYHLPLTHSLPTWWSKLEMFKLVGTVITIDLDMIPVADCSALLELAQNLKPYQFMTLNGLRQEPWGSVIMIWNGDFRWIEIEFLKQYKTAEHSVDHRGHHLIINGTHYHGDQEWIIPQLQIAGIEIIGIQNHFAGIYSYKDGIRDKEFPKNAKVICFHGKPRPHQISPTADWMIREGWTD